VERGDDVEVVGHRDGDTIAGRDAERRERTRRLIRPTIELGVRHPSRARDECLVVGIATQRVVEDGRDARRHHRRRLRAAQ
jgi:hypothetical protein